MKNLRDKRQSRFFVPGTYFMPPMGAQTGKAESARRSVNFKSRVFRRTFEQWQNLILKEIRTGSDHRCQCVRTIMLLRVVPELPNDAAQCFRNERLNFCATKSEQLSRKNYVDLECEDDQQSLRQNKLSVRSARKGFAVHVAR